MVKIPHKIQERIKAALRRFKPLLKAARERDAGRADTATLALDLLSELFGYDRYTEITSELDKPQSHGLTNLESKESNIMSGAQVFD